MEQNINLYYYNKFVSNLDILDKQRYYTCKIFDKYVYGEFEKLNKDTYIIIKGNHIKIEFELYESSLKSYLDQYKMGYTFMYTFKIKYPKYVPIIKEYPGTIPNVTITQGFIPKMDFKLPKNVEFPEFEVLEEPVDLYPKYSLYPSYTPSRYTSYRDDNSHVNWYKRDSGDLKTYSNKSHIHNNFYLCDKDEYMDFRINNHHQSLESFFLNKITAINNRNIVWCFSMKQPVKIGSTHIDKYTYDEEDYCKIYSHTNFSTIENFNIDEVRNNKFSNVEKFKNTYNSKNIYYTFENSKDLDKIRNIVEEKLLLHAYNNCQNTYDDYYICFDNIKFEYLSTPRMFEYSKMTVLLLTVNIIKIKIN